MRCEACTGSGYDTFNTTVCSNCRGSGVAAAVLDVVNVSDFRCHMCGDRNIENQNLQPCTLKIGAMLQLSCYMCKPCQIKLAGHVKQIVSMAPPQAEKTGVDRNIIL